MKTILESVSKYSQLLKFDRVHRALLPLVVFTFEHLRTLCRWKFEFASVHHHRVCDIFCHVRSGCPLVCLKVSRIHAT